jgi:hypothetical protein
MLSPKGRSPLACTISGISTSSNFHPLRQALSCHSAVAPHNGQCFSSNGPTSFHALRDIHMHVPCTYPFGQHGCPKTGSPAQAIPSGHPNSLLTASGRVNHTSWFKMSISSSHAAAPVFTAPEKNPRSSLRMISTPSLRRRNLESEQSSTTITRMSFGRLFSSLTSAVLLSRYGMMIVILRLQCSLPQRRIRALLFGWGRQLDGPLTSAQKLVSM